LVQTEALDVRISYWVRTPVPQLTVGGTINKSLGVDFIALIDLHQTVAV